MVSYWKKEKVKQKMSSVPEWWWKVHEKDSSWCAILSFLFDHRSLSSLEEFMERNVYTLLAQAFATRFSWRTHSLEKGERKRERSKWRLLDGLTSCLPCLVCVHCNKKRKAKGFGLVPQQYQHQPYLPVESGGEDLTKNKHFIHLPTQVGKGSTEGRRKKRRYPNL